MRIPARVAVIARRNVVNVRASYFEETEKIIDTLVRDRGVKRVAVLYQDDSYGRAGLAGLREALERRHLKLSGTGTYARNTTAVKTASTPTSAPSTARILICVDVTTLLYHAFP